MSASTITTPQETPALTPQEERLLHHFRAMDDRGQNGALTRVEREAKKWPRHAKPSLRREGIMIINFDGAILSPEEKQMLASFRAMNARSRAFISRTAKSQAARCPVSPAGAAILQFKGAAPRRCAPAPRIDVGGES